MTDAEKITMVKALVESDAEATDEVVAVYLNLACSAMIERLFPYDTEKGAEDLPERYDTIQCELAARYFLRRGGQGELSHEENGINRSYASVDDDDILKRLTPYAKVGG
jgi:hypothetical protein